MLRAAEYLKKELLKSGASRAEVFPTAGHPVVYGENPDISKIFSKYLGKIL